jgi:hypothetical protein
MNTASLNHLLSTLMWGCVLTRCLPVCVPACLLQAKELESVSAAKGRLEEAFSRSMAELR